MSAVSYETVTRAARALHLSRGILHRLFWLNDDECSECMVFAEVTLEASR